MLAGVVSDVAYPIGGSESVKTQSRNTRLVEQF